MGIKENGEEQNLDDFAMKAKKRHNTRQLKNIFGGAVEDHAKKVPL